MSIGRHHAEWLSLIEVSGPFLTLPVLVRTLPQGLPKTQTGKLGQLRAAYEEWAEAQRGTAQDAAAIQANWIQLVISQVLEFDAETLRIGDGLPSELELALPEHHEVVRPSMAVVAPAGGAKAGAARLLIAVCPHGQDLEEPVPDARWAASPLERMTQLCRATKVRLGLVTNGERWTLVDAPVGQTAGYASWYSGLWLQEPTTLAAFETLLGVRRFFAVAETDTLEGLLHESVAYQQEVTDQLGYQVRRAVEVLVQALDRADLDRERELLKDVPPERLYEAALTMMMRLVFLFCAEERGLLLLGDETYDLNYAVSTLRAQLREEADVVGVEVLERRQDAWARLLATFRAVYGGVEHEALRLPALGGSLFDPDRYPFLEGRALGTCWLDTAASPLPIDNRTVLHLLEALQLLKMKGDAGTSEARKLSYRALDIEQIGHVYEGLLDHIAVRVEDDTLGLLGTKDKEPELTIADLDRERRKGRDALVDFLKEQTGRSVSALRNDLDAECDEEAEQRLLVACGNDKALVKRVEPYHALLGKDVWGYPQIYRAGGVMVTGGSERRQTGTHYTPRSLTERIVTETLEPLVYDGPTEGKAKAEWLLRTPLELLDLKICDMAMGSAAFLVQVCRWLGERLVEAWEAAERDGKAISADGKVLEARAGHDLLPPDRDERLSLARRLIAERCVYGVDINPMAVELAKLSLWLVTLAKGRPFGFLDHNLRCGDSLLGITSLEQVENFHLDPAKGRELHKGLFDPKHRIQAAVSKASELRRQLCGTRILDIEDVRSMARLDAEAKQLFAAPELVADVLLGAAVQGDESTDDLLKSIADDLQRALVHGGNDAERVRHRARELLDADCPERLKPRRPFHWAIEFPEVFGRDRSGFDAVVGNPPFLYGKRVSGVLGSGYSDHLSAIHRPATKNVDFSMHFVRRAATLVREAGTIGIIATSSIAEGQTREAGLDWMLHNNFSIYSADARLSWPGRAAVLISRISLMRGSWSGNTTLDCRRVESISAYLTADATFAPVPLTENEGLAFRGVVPNGMGFVIDHEQATEFIRVRPRNRKVVLPYLIGEDVNTDPEQRPSRWIINFWDWNRETAEEYVEPFQWVRKHVKPHRDQMGEQKKSVKDRWWQFEAVGRDLFTAIGRRDVFQNAQSRTGRLGNASPLRRVIGIARVSKTGAFTFLSNDAVFCEVTVIASDDAAVLALLQSSVHMVFAWAIAGRMKNDLRYSPTACLQAFPFPRDVGAREKLSQLGEALTECRTAAMNTRQIGLTKLYKLVHQVTCKDPDIQSLREIQKQIDLQTALSYGWTLNLEHGFHNVGYLPESDRCRFTVSEVARTELLARLSLLNRQRALEHAQSCAWFSETHSFGSVSGASRSNKRSTSQANAMDTDPSFELIALNPGAAKGSGTSTRRRRQ